MVVARFVSADEAIKRQRIRKPTLYAYVSRGLIRAHTAPGSKRKSVYLSSDVEELLAKKKQGRSTKDAARAAISWGLPVLETAISTVERGRLYYRGIDAVMLANDGATLEDAARILWG